MINGWTKGASEMSEVTKAVCWNNNTFLIQANLCSCYALPSLKWQNFQKQNTKCKLPFDNAAWVFLVQLTLRLWRAMQNFPPKYWMNFTRLHGVVSQKNYSYHSQNIKYNYNSCSAEEFSKIFWNPKVNLFSTGARQWTQSQARWMQTILQSYILKIHLTFIKSVPRF
jgi:hypothetical protein